MFDIRRWEAAISKSFGGFSALTIFAAAVAISGPVFAQACYPGGAPGAINLAPYQRFMNFSFNSPGVYDRVVRASGDNELCLVTILEQSGNPKEDGADCEWKKYEYVKRLSRDAAVVSIKVACPQGSIPLDILDRIAAQRSSDYTQDMQDAVTYALPPCIGGNAWRGGQLVFLEAPRGKCPDPDSVARAGHTKYWK